MVFVAIAALFSLYENGGSKVEKIGIEKFIIQINNEEIESIIVRGAKLDITLKDGVKEMVKKETGEKCD